MSRLKAFAVLATVSAGAALYVACGPSGTVPPPPTGPLDIVIEASTEDAGDDASDGAPATTPVSTAYTGVPEWTGPCQAAAGAIDVNMGNSPASFVTAAYCQIYGTMPSSDVVTNWATQLETLPYLRRVDVVIALCEQADKQCVLQYSVPWQDTVLPTDTCTRKGTRDVGAVMLFFFSCPLGTNCTMNWANTHAWGMDGDDVTYGFGSSKTGYYNPSNAGFWLRELLDARHAGLQFVLPNEYGNDVQYLTYLEQALTTIDGMGGGIQVGLFDDTSNWGRAAGMSPAPSFSDPQAAAAQIYAAQWKPFFSTVSKPHWFTVKGTNSPLIYFYNAGTLGPVAGTSAVISAMKQMFQADFGVTPYVNVDKGYGPVTSADAQFTWDTFTNFPGFYYGTESTPGGLTLANSMVKWDSLGRDQPGVTSDGGMRMFKDTGILQSVLSATSGTDMLLIETWNDLGEGTGITRNYDYYFDGGWQTPDVFMNLIRASQCSN